MLVLTDGEKTNEWVGSDIPYLNQLFSQKEHEQHQLQQQERPQEEPENFNHVVKILNATAN